MIQEKETAPQRLFKSRLVDIICKTNKQTNKKRLKKSLSGMSSFWDFNKNHVELKVQELLTF